MNTEEFKQEIAEKTGLPITLLTGETVEENIAQAKAILAFKREQDLQRLKTNSEKFAELFNQIRGVEAQDGTGAALAQIEEQARLSKSGYSFLQNNNNANTGNTKPVKEQFADYMERFGF